jgi:photosystem II stability/assembly factor-like uncharacterized protein/predicted acyltransferase (DUF342 family)
MASWKSYGGINNFEQTNNITVDSLSANYFTLKNEYVGYFSICGELSVSENTYLRSNVDIGGNNRIRNDCTVGGNTLVSKNIDMSGNLYVGKNVDISGDTLMWGNLHLMQNYEIEGNLMINGNILQMGLLKRNPKEYNINLHSVDKKLGFNTANPSYTLDINSDQIDGFSISTTKSSNKNIIAQNSSKQGIVVKTDISNSSINFFNENTIQNTVSDSSITYSIGGNMVIKNSNNTLLKSKVSISNRNLGDHSIHNETAIIYDVSSGTYLHNVYENVSFSTGSALSLISDSSSSNTGVNIMTPNGKGIKLMGGSEITNKSRSSGIIGIVDGSYDLVPSLSIISGNSRVKNRSSIGINKCVPEVDELVLDINGKTKISHSEIVMVSNTKYEIKKIVFSTPLRRNGFAFGSPVSINQSPNSTYKQVLLYTHDGGAKWSESIYSSTELGSSLSSVLQTGCTVGENIGFVGGENTLLLFSTDSYVTWSIMDYTLPSTSSSINITNLNTSKLGTSITLYIFHILTQTSGPDQQKVGYFEFPSMTFESLSVRQTFILQSISFTSNTSLTSRTNSSCIFPSSIIIVGNSGISRLELSNGILNQTTYYVAGEYNSVSKFVDGTNSILIAVGNGLINVSMNEGIFWTRYTTGLSNIILNDIYIHSLSTAIAVGNNGAIYVTTNGGEIWNTIEGIINNSGTGNLILNSERDLISVNMTDDNTFIITSRISKYLIINNIPQPAESKIYFCHFPAVFNNSNNNVLDICGNMGLSGNMDIYGNVNLSKNLTTMGSITCGDTINTQYLDSVTNKILIGTVGGGKTIRIFDSTTASISNPNRWY